MSGYNRSVSEQPWCAYTVYDSVSMTCLLIALRR